MPIKRSSNILWPKKKILRHIFKIRGLENSLGFALKGILYLFLYHRNMRIIFLLGLLTLLAGMSLNVSPIELAILCVTITIVFVAEIFNTAIEMSMDMLKTKYHTRIKIVKDIAAAVVLIAALNASILGFIILFNKLAVYL